MNLNLRGPSSNPFVGFPGHLGVPRDESRRPEPKIRVSGILLQTVGIEDSSQPLSLVQVIKIVRKVRPDWPREDIILHRLPSSAGAEAGGGGGVTGFGAYTDNKGEAVIVRVYSGETRSGL